MRKSVSSSVLVLALLSAGCSSEAMRFGDPFSNPFGKKTGSLASSSSRLSPEQSYKTAAVAPIMRSGADNDVVTGSIKKRIIPEVKSTELKDSVQQAWAGKGAIKPALQMPPRPKEMQSKQTNGGWSPIGGTTIITRGGDSVKVLSERYGVPASAIAQANGIGAEAELNAGKSLVIPTYSLNRSASLVKKKEAEIVPEKVGITGLRSQKSVDKKNDVKIAKDTLAKKETVAKKEVAVAKPVPSFARNKREHIVKEGDNLSTLSGRYGVSQEQLAKANGLDKWGQVKVGQNLVVPAAIAATTVAVAKPVVKQQVVAMKPQVVAMKPKVREDNIVTGSIAPNKKLTAMKPVVQDNLVKTAAVTPSEPARTENEFRWPLRSAKVISNFGDDLNGIPNEGINFSVPEGTEIRASEEGEVVYAGNGSREPSLKNYGNLILLRHAEKYVTVYAHAKDVNVKVGDKVKRGQVIGRVGQTGSVSSPQLHFEVRQGKQSIDPEQKIRG